MFPWLRKKVVKQIDTDQVEIVHQADSLLERILKRCYIPILFSRVGKLFTVGASLFFYIWFLGF